MSFNENLNAFMLGQRLRPGLMGVGVEERTPFAYNYNGLVLPALPEWDKMKYPYVVYTDGGAIASATPFIAKQGFTLCAYPSATYLFCDLTWDANGEYLSGWEERTEDDYIVLYNYWYTNHAIYLEDGTVYAPANDTPTPVYLPAIMFEGELTTTVNGAVFTSLCGWTVGDVVRVTVNGVTEEHTVRIRESAPMASYGGVIGNEGLTSSTNEYDNGGDWFIDVMYRSGLTADYGQATFCFYTRTPGTYQLKIELISKG